MMFFFEIVSLLVLLGQVDAKKKASTPTVINYNYNYHYNTNCTGECNIGNVTINNNNNTSINNTINQNNTYINQTDESQCFNLGNSTVVFSAYLDHDFTAGSQDTKIPFSKDTLNKGGAFDNATGTFTAPVKGGYTFSFSVMALGGHDKWTEAWMQVETTDGKRTILAGARADNWVITSNTVNVELEKGAAVSVMLYRTQKIHAWIPYKGTTFSGHLLYIA